MRAKGVMASGDKVKRVRGSDSLNISLEARDVT